MKVKRSVNCPVVLLYPIPFEPERERREILPDITVSCASLVPWSFWNAERMESVLVTIPEPATNHERSEVRLSFPEKVL